MRYSKLFAKTLRSSPGAFHSDSFKLLYRAGFVRTLGQGLISFLPLGLRVVRRIQDIIREEMNALGGQEAQVPIVNPGEMWKRTARHQLLDRDMVHFRDRAGRELVLAPTHEEAMVELVRVGLESYRDLPVFLYQFQTKFRDEERPRAGLVRAREFMMKDAYSFHRSFSDLNNFFPRVFAAYKRIFERVGIDAIAAEAGVGYMAGDKSFEFLMASEAGEDEVVTCPNCAYTANREVAVEAKQVNGGRPASVKEVETPGCETMDDLSNILGLPKTHLAKTMGYVVPGGFALAVVRGDKEVSLEKLSRVLGKPIIRLAHADELRALGLIPGYMSPIGAPESLPAVIDERVADTPNMVYGANRSDRHLKNVNYGRDYESPHVADISVVDGRGTCFYCGHQLTNQRVMELGNIFRLGEYYSRSMGLTFREESGKKVYPQMGSYGIGIGRLLAAIVENHRDHDGIVWPREVAPYKAYLMSIGKSLSVREALEELHEQLGDEALLDDREESIGTKFKDAALLGLPCRILVTQETARSNQVEIQDRKSRKTVRVDISRVSQIVAEGCAELEFSGNES